MFKRIKWLDFAKGFTIFLVVLVHALGGIYSHNLYPETDNFLAVLAEVGLIVIMPVFFALSGYLYESTNTLSQYFSLIRKKACSLLIPYIIFSVIFVIIQHLGSSAVRALYSWNSLLYIWYKPISYLWFLYVLFWIFLIVGLLDIFKISKYIQLIIYIFLFISSQIWKLPYSLTIVFRWVIFFYAGTYCRKYLNIVQNKRIIILNSFIFFIGLLSAFSFNGINADFDYPYFWNFIPKFISVFLFIGVYSIFPQNRFFKYFEKYGRYSLIIYMIHMPAISAFRTLIIHFFLPNVFIMLILLTSFGWFASLAVVWLSKRFTWINFVFDSYHYLKRLRTSYARKN